MSLCTTYNLGAYAISKNSEAGLGYEDKVKNRKTKIHMYLKIFKINAKKDIQM